MNKVLKLSIIIVLLIVYYSCTTPQSDSNNGKDEKTENKQSGKTINHNCIDINAIPESAIINTKNSLHIGYGHTSHGSQITDGMGALDAFMGGSGLYTFNNTGAGGALDLREDMGNYGSVYGASDLNQPNYTAWDGATRAYLTANPEINVIIWSWCAGVSHADVNNIANDYLARMNQLEQDYPWVIFVYMTGHLDGSGITGNLHLRNEQIREYCRNNNKWLYDFADIESYNPDGLINYMQLNADDHCDYDSDANGSLDRNWATDWQTAHTIDVDWYSCGAVHSYPLNANMKAYAAWWLWASLAGW